MAVPATAQEFQAESLAVQALLDASRQEMRAIAAPAQASAAGWDLEKPPDGGPGSPAPPTDSPSAPEWQRFWDRLQDKAFDDICKNIQIPLNKTFRPQEHVAVEVGIERRLHRYADRRLAIVDRTKLGLSLGMSHSLLDAGSEVPISIGIEARAQGQALIIRPLEGTRDCDEIKTLLNIIDFKTVVPITAERLGAMRLGELWKLPLVLRLGATLGAGYPLGPAAISVSIGYAQEDTASISLFRLREDALRLRIRLDNAEIKTGGGAISVGLPIAEFLGLDGDPGFLEKQADRLLLRTINRYLTNSLGLNYWKRDGRKVLLEFVLDPRDPEQMEVLADFIKGNLSALKILLRIITKTASTDVQDGDLADELAKIGERNAKALSAQSSFAGTSDHERSGGRFHLQVPFLVRHESDSTKESDRIITGGDRNSSVHIRQASSQESNAWLDIPFMGQIFKGNSSKTVQTMTKVDSKGFADAPFLSYIQQDGFVRKGENSARESVEQANDIMRYAGTRGEGENPDLQLPIDAMFPRREPPPPGAPRRNHRNQDMGPPQAPNPTYRSSLAAFSLIFNEQALRDMLWAPAVTIVKAVMNALSGENRGLAKLALEHTKIADDGTFEVDRPGMRKALMKAGVDIDDNKRGGRWVYNELVGLVKTAAMLVADLVEARAGAWEERMRSMVKIVSGKGESGLEYDHIMKVLIQLTDPANILGEFRVVTNKKIDGEKDLSSRYLLNKDNSVAAFKEALILKERFAEPSLLLD